MLDLGQLDTGKVEPAEVIIREAQDGDEWAIARVHCDSFYPDAGIFSPIMRIDKVLALKVTSFLPLPGDSSRDIWVVPSTLYQ
jgi:hypothetical protein